MNNFSSNNIAAQSNILGTIPVDNGAWGMINYSNDTNKISIYNPTLDDIDIIIVDAETGQNINFWNSNWTMTLILNIIRKIEFIERPMLKNITERLGVLKPLENLDSSQNQEYYEPSIKRNSILNQNEKDLNLLIK